MIITFKHFIGAHEFKVICDKDSILTQIENERKTFEGNFYQRLHEVGHEDGYLNEAEYNENLNAMVSLLEDITTESSMVDFIVNAKKKKNGTFHKGRIAYNKSSDNTTFITDWNNTWIYNALQVTALSDFILLIDYRNVVETPA